MTDSVFWKGLVLWMAGFAVFALVGGGVFAAVFFGIGQSPEAMDDLYVSNRDDGNHTVRIEVTPANASDDSSTFDRATTLEASESRSFDGATEVDEAYGLLVTVDDREPESFELTGPDDYCTTEVRVESSTTVEVGTSCA